MNAFRKTFLQIFTEQDGVTDIEAQQPDIEARAVADTMDDPAMAQELSVPDNPEIALKRQQSAKTITTITTWIGEVENFIDYLNGTDSLSINAQLNAADCDSLLTDIQRSESKKISRLAQDLSSLGESLKQYLLLARRKESGSDSI
jgi:hypothetical protein